MWLEFEFKIWTQTRLVVTLHIGFQVCEYNAGLFIHMEQKNVYLIIHVDDFKIVAVDTADAEWVVTVTALPLAV